MNAEDVKPPKILDLSQPLKVQYCIPLWLRDEQIKHSTARIKLRLERYDGPIRQEPIAIVCFGPSLNDTWEQLRFFPGPIISCSGAHKFLLERGIVPTYHVEVDPRLHKTILLGEPHPDVTYLPAATCHPGYFDHLEKYLGKDAPNVRLWHVFANEEDSIRALPSSEWALTGGSSVGLRCLTIAHFLGYWNLHIFGMDGSEGASGKHAAAHPSQPKGHSIVIANGKEFRTTPSMAECARQTFHELDQMPEVRATFYGEGLTQELAKSYVPDRTPKKGAMLAFSKPDLISASYRELNTRLHKDNLAYGVGGGKHADIVKKIVSSGAVRSVLDYGCGKGALQKALPFPIWEYDPAVPEKSASPRAADLVVCSDVLEHIEPEKLIAVLADLRRCTLQVGYFTIHTGPAGKTLADGRNAHLIQHGREWWEKKLSKFFTIEKITKQGPELVVVVSPKKVKAVAQTAVEGEKVKA